MVFIIGEIGTNHAGSVKIAKKIIDAAVDAGFDAVKFQKKNVEKIYTNEFLDSYLESPWGTTQREMRLYREFSDTQFKEIDKYCKKKKIPWFVSCWDIGSQIHMRRFKTKYNKVSSAMLIHEKLLKIIDLNKVELSILTLLALSIIFFGFYPDPFSNTYSVSVENFLNEYNDKLNSYNLQNQ